MIKAFFFDLDGTLYDRDALIGDLVAGQFDLFQTELIHVGKARFVERILELDGHGHGDKDDPIAEVYRKVAEEWGLGTELVERLREHFWSDYDQRLRLPDDTSTTLQELGGHRKKLGVITNGGAIKQRKRLNLLGIASMFNTILVSETEGVRKPDEAIFQRALERCDVKANEAVFIGDDPKADVAGARRAGLVAVWKFVPYWKLATENVLTICQLNEILPIFLDG